MPIRTPLARGALSFLVAALPVVAAAGPRVESDARPEPAMTNAILGSTGSSLESDSVFWSMSRSSVLQSIGPDLAQRRQFEPLAEAAAQANDLNVEFFKRLIRQESGYDPVAVSSAGAQGIAQFMPGTASLVGLNNPFDPLQALGKSAELLSTLYRRFGNQGLAAAAYNAGEGRLRAWLAGRGSLAAETRQYVLTITGRPIGSWTTPEAARLSRSAGTATRIAAIPTFVSYSSSEWRIGVGLLDGKPVLRDLLGNVASSSRTQVKSAGTTSSRRPPKSSGEASLCESMRTTGCIVARVY